MSKKFHKMMESANKGEALRFIKLNESNIEKAEIVLAVKGEIVDKLQRQSEVINNMGVDVLGPLLDRIKAEHGVEHADAFRNNISGLLDTAVKTLMDVKDKISTETLKLTGDITSDPTIADLGTDEIKTELDLDTSTPEFDFESDVDFTDDIAEPVPSDREMKESRKFTQVGVRMESHSGTVGIKYFGSKKEMQTWLTENEKKVKKILGVVKK